MANRREYILPVVFENFPDLEISMEINEFFTGSIIPTTNIAVSFYGYNKGTKTIRISEVLSYSIQYDEHSSFRTAEGYALDEDLIIYPGKKEYIAGGRINSIDENLKYNTKYILNDKKEKLKIKLRLDDVTKEFDFDIDITPYLNRSLNLVVAPNFYTTDNNVSIRYSNANYSSSYNYVYDIALSIDGVNPIIDFREIDHSQAQGFYTIELTDTEKQAIFDNLSMGEAKVYYLLRTYVEYKKDTSKNYYTIDRAERLCMASDAFKIFPTVKDINQKALDLTGDENTFIKGISTAEYNIGATPSEGGTIVSQWVRCGETVKEDLPVGIIENVESGTFSFYAMDNKLGNSGVVTLEKKLIDYIKPTCSQKASIELDGETGAKVILEISGNYFNGSFGAVPNELKLEVRHTQNDGTMGDWVEISALMPEFNGNTYSITVNVTGLTYTQAYTFQCRASDKLRFAESAQYTVKLTPTFDWSGTDFVFNVPVDIKSDSLSMNGEQIIRHNTTVGNIVLSATGGHIYLRPGGTNDTSSEVRCSANGNLEIKGDLLLNGVSLLGILRQGGLID